MQRPGIDLTLLVPSAWPEAGQPVAYVPDAGTPYRVIASRALFPGVHALHVYPLLPYYLWRHRPDVLHLEEEPWNLVTLVAALVGKLLGVRIVFFTWENVRRSYPPPLNLFLRLVLRLSDAAIAGSETARELLRARGFRKRVHVLPQYGVDLPPRGRAASTDGRFVVGFAGRLVPQKGLDCLLDAVAGLPPAAHLLVIGDGPYREAVLERARNLGLDRRVEMAGAVAHWEIAGYLSRMNVLVLPSLTTTRWKEQFGRVLTEAMALGVPVVGSDSGEIPWVIGDAGLVFPEGRSAVLRDRLRALFDDDGLMRELSERGRRRVADHFTNHVLADRTRAIYDEVAGHARRAHDLAEPAE